MPAEMNPTQQTVSIIARARTFISRFYAFLPQGLRGYLVPAFGTLITLLGFWFSPLKEMVFHKIWAESPTVEVRPSADRIREGDEFGVSVVVTPHSIDLSPGTLFVDYSQETLQLRGPGNVISMAATTQPFTSILTFRALHHGPAEIHIVLRTKYGSYEATKSFFLSDLSVEAPPSKFNYSGTWNLRIDQMYGELHLVDHDGAISGKYELESGDVGSIRGVRGPAAIQLSLLSNNNTHHKYVFQCLVTLQDEFLELKGDANAGSGTTQKITFYASSKT